MTNEEVTQQQIDELLDDAAYLQDEAEALKYIIDAVPFSQVPEEGMSILQKLMLIDYAQIDYYRPIVEKSFSSTRTVDLRKFDHYKDTYEPSDEEDIHKVLNKLIKHRAGLLNVIKKIPLIDWEREIKVDSDKMISLYLFINQLIKDEREQLKEIADLVLIYQNNKQQNRLVNAKISERNETGD
ncbi:MAG: hypothetical protein WEA58_00705 [Balneolaceae bacterium]